MRELKFRAWSLEYKCYVDVWEITFDDEGLPGVLSFEYNGLLHKEPAHNFVLEQYTGLKDKNGKEIYEGDIIQEEIDFNSKMTDGAFTYVVEWDSDTLCYRLRADVDSIHDELWEVNASVEIVGNIHENPELLGDTNVTNKEEEWAKKY